MRCEWCGGRREAVACVVTTHGLWSHVCEKHRDTLAQRDEKNEIVYFSPGSVKSLPTAG